MKKIFYVIFLLLPITALSQDPVKQRLAKIETLIKKYSKANNIPTLNAGIIIDGKIHYINHGVQNLKTGTKTDENSIFQIASVGKVLTGIVINDLILKEKIDLYEPILSYFPETYSEKTKSKIKRIRIKDLLHHRSGLARQSKVIKRRNDEPIIFDYTESDFEKDFEKMKLTSSGEFEYSNFGYAVLAFIAEQVTGSTFEELLADVLKPYGLEITSSKCKDKHLLVTPYNEDDRKTEAKIWDMGMLAPPSGLYSSVSDLSKLLLAQMKVYEDSNKENHLFLTKNVREAWDKTGITYGCGLFDWGNGGFGHGGGMDGFGSEYWFNPKENVGLVILTSSGGIWVPELSKEINKILIEIDAN